TVKGSFEETQSISLRCDSRSPLPDPTFFHYAKYKQPSLDVAFTKKRRFPSFCACISCGARKNRSVQLSLPLKSLPSEQEVVGEHRKFDLRFQVKNCPEDLDVRLGFDLCAQEQDFICKRKKVVAAALKDVLRLQEDLQEDEVPVVAIMTTGGGTRALTAMYSHLRSIQKLNVLDCVSYITGLSGTTCTQVTRTACVPECWGRGQLKRGVIAHFCMKPVGHILAGAWCATPCWSPGSEAAGDSWFHLTQLTYCPPSKQEDFHKLTDQQQALKQGQNPLPIYLSLNVKDKCSNQDFREWVEFTPYEVGLLKYGAFIRAEDFGSEFFMGRLMKKIPESRICFLEGNLLLQENVM
ncbi:PA24E phospholipase, partial [Nothocercus nigrocapillus]|nr:PA24E phospholipase [Nothocercus nigrocapillus]